MASLLSLRHRLQSMGIDVELRGSGASSFLFIDHHGRSVEISINNDNRWWIEFWEHDDDPDALPVKETTLGDELLVEKEVVAWLRI